MLRTYGRLISGLSTGYRRYASTAVTPKPRGRPAKSKDASPETPRTKEAGGEVKKDEKPKGLSEIQARLEATGYSRRRNAATRKPKTEALPKPTTKAKAKPSTTVQPPPPPRRQPKKPKLEPLPPRVLPPTNPKHHDLTSFLSYASRTALNTASTVYRGTHFEYTVAHTLRQLDFMLQRTGRSNDLGIDLVGHWMLPAHTQSHKKHSHTMPVLIQCKATKTTPSMIRELEGAYAGAPAGWRGEGVLAVLVSTQHTTKGVVGAVQRSRLPLAVMQITREGVVKQFLWNAVAAEAGLEGMGVTMRYSPPLAENGKEGGGDREIGQEVGQAVALTWMGKVWRPVEKKVVRGGTTAEAAILPTVPEDTQHALV